MKMKGFAAFRVLSEKTDGKEPKRKDNTMKPTEFGLFCIDQTPEMPTMPTESTFPAKVSLAMMYVPFQRFERLYDEEKALSRGTLFEELDLPFYGGKRGNGK